MSVELISIKYLKLVLIYVFYTYFLKVFFHLFSPLIYAYSPENIDRDLFFEGKGDSVVTKIISIFFVNIAMDLIWLLPFTIMNLFVFIKLIGHLIKGNGSTYQYISFILLKVYLFWCLIYLCYFSFVFFTNNAVAQDYPFTLSNTIKATLNVDTHHTRHHGPSRQSHRMRCREL